MTETITVETVVRVPASKAWRAYTEPEAITEWNFASPDWHCPSSDVDLRPGGRHLARMEARDGSMGFDYEGVYEEIEPERSFILRLEDGRRVYTAFEPHEGGTLVRTVFDPDPAAPADMQRAGWQAILDNYSEFVERSAT
ncbi:MAG: SRPBCC domain-containing protein [Devosia sp.]